MAGYIQNSSFKALVVAQNWVCRVRFICNYELGPQHTVNKIEKQAIRSNKVVWNWEVSGL